MGEGDGREGGREGGRGAGISSVLSNDVCPRKESMPLLGRSSFPNNVIIDEEALPRM
jgi:hypothetical protein